MLYVLSSSWESPPSELDFNCDTVSNTFLEAIASLR